MPSVELWLVSFMGDQLSVNANAILNVENFAKLLEVVFHEFGPGNRGGFSLDF